MTRHRKEETLSEYSAKLARGIEFLEKYRQLCPRGSKADYVARGEGQGPNQGGCGSYGYGL